MPRTRAGTPSSDAHDTLVDEVIPRIIAAMEQAAEAAKASADAAQDRAVAAIAVAEKAAKKQQAAVAPKHTFARTLGWVLVGTAIVGAGVLVWRRTQPVDDPWAEEYWDDSPAPAQPAGSPTASVADKAKHAASSVADSVSDAAGKAKDAASDAVSKVKDKAEDVSGKAKDVAGDASSTAEDVADDATDKAEDVVDSTKNQAKDATVGVTDPHGRDPAPHRVRGLVVCHAGAATAVGGSGQRSATPLAVRECSACQDQSPLSPSSSRRRSATRSTTPTPTRRVPTR